MRQRKSQDEFDYVIIGGGAAGCLLAERLSRSASHQVLLLNAGAGSISLWSHLPLGYGALIGNPEHDWMLPGEPDAGFANRRFSHSEGRALGGGGSINGLIFLRGDRCDYDGWRALGNPGWGYADVLPAFRAIETFQGPPDPERGTQGPIHVRNQPDHYALDQAFIDAAVQSGAPLIDDFNRGTTEGAGYYQINTKNGRRSSSATACLQPALKRPNLVVLSRAHATRILFKDKEAVGVEFLRNGTTQKVAARREVILAAGAYHSPQLLQLSGVGPKELLGRHGITPVHHLPGVGENFQNHYNLTVSYRTSATSSLNQSLRSFHGRLGLALKYALTRRGPLATNATHVGLHLCSSDEIAWPDIKLTLSLFSRRGQNFTNVRKDLHAFPGFSVHVHHLRPDFSGSVRIVSANPTDAPEIRVGFSPTANFTKAMGVGVRRLRSLIQAPAMASMQPEELAPTRDCITDEQILDVFRTTGINSSHPVGTCKMGSDDSSVVNSRLQVHGLARLRVIDASVMPTQIAANTHATTLMIAERGARFILGEETA